MQAGRTVWRVCRAWPMPMARGRAGMQGATRPTPKRCEQRGFQSRTYTEEQAMRVPRGPTVLVADGGKMLLLENRGAVFNLRTEVIEQQATNIPTDRRMGTHP